jgi:thiamine biosynthesis lipoprotein
VRADTAQWPVWDTVARIVVTDPAAVPAARDIVEAELAEVDAACSRFRPDSELRRACTAPGPVTVSARLAELVGAALAAARDTDGDVDPTVGAAICALGYDADLAGLFDKVPPAAGATVRTASAGGATLRMVPAADWRQVRLRGRELTVPAGVLLDLGATAKALAADRCAALVSTRLGLGVLVSLGGDIATAGPAPAGGWQVRVSDGAGEPCAAVALPGGAALATSSTQSRRWRHAGELMHHVLDPRTGRPAAPVWRTASVAAFTCVRANTLSTAALVRGDRAVTFLRRLGAPARLVAAGGTVTTLGAWPAEPPAGARPAEPPAGAGPAQPPAGAP